MKEYKCCSSFIELVSPSLEEIREEWARKIVIRFNNVARIALQYEVVIHPVGEGIIFQFPKTRDLTDVNAITDVLECSLQQMERRMALSTQLAKDELPEISYRITIDYQTYFESEPGDEEHFFGPLFAWRFIRKIGNSAPANIVVVGSELYKTVTAFPQLLQKYKFENIGKYLIDGSKDCPYPIYSLSRI
ncbi:MAG: hypothetical protein ACHQ1D_09715 [Nitrososphaerales archaeon]